MATALIDFGRGLPFRLLRRYKPVVVVGGRNGGVAFVLRYADVAEVYSRDEVFSVRLYDHRMAETTGRFILGMDDGETYRREAGLVRQLWQAGDLERVRLYAQAEAERVVDAVLDQSGRIDVVADLATLVHASILAHYHGFEGLPAPEAVRLFRTSAFYVFNFWPGSWLQAPAIDASHAINAQLRACLASRKAARAGGAPTGAPGAPRDDLLNRFLDLRAAQPALGLTDDDILRTMAGIVSGSVEPGMSSFTYLLDQLLDRPAVLRELRALALAGDHAAIEPYLLEAARFGCYPPGLSRFCRRDHVFGIGTRWERRIGAGTTVVPLQASGMFDPDAFAAPYTFDTHRPSDRYLNFGTGIHRCAGEALGKQIWIGMAIPLLRRANLRRVPGPNAFPRKGRRFDIPGGFYVQHLEVTAD